MLGGTTLGIGGGRATDGNGGISETGDETGPGDTLPEKGGSFGASLGGEATGGDFPGKSFTGIVAGAGELGTETIGSPAGALLPVESAGGGSATSLIGEMDGGGAATLGTGGRDG